MDKSILLILFIHKVEHFVGLFSLIDLFSHHIQKWNLKLNNVNSEHFHKLQLPNFFNKFTSEEKSKVIFEISIEK